MVSLYRLSDSMSPSTGYLSHGLPEQVVSLMVSQYMLSPTHCLPVQVVSDSWSPSTGGLTHGLPVQVV